MSEFNKPAETLDANLADYALAVLDVYGRDELCEAATEPGDHITCWGLLPWDEDGWRRKPCRICVGEELIARANGEEPRPWPTPK